MLSARKALLRARISYRKYEGHRGSIVTSARGADAAALEADVKRAVEKAERAVDSWRFEVTDFYPPPVCAEVLQKVSTWADVTGRAVGGYPNAERCRLVVAREEMLVTEAAESEFVTALQVRHLGYESLHTLQPPEFIAVLLAVRSTMVQCGAMQEASPQACAR